MPRVWFDNVLTTVLGIGTISNTDLLADSDPIQTRINQMTLLRTIIGLDLGRTVHDSGEGSERVSLGIGVISQEAFAATVTPDPNVQGDFPPRGWVWRSVYRTYGFAADQPAVHSVRIDLDLRSMRKLENGVMCLTMLAETLEGSSSTVTALGIIRQLYLVK